MEEAGSQTSLRRMLSGNPELRKRCLIHLTVIYSLWAGSFTVPRRPPKLLDCNINSRNCSRNSLTARSMMILPQFRVKDQSYHIVQIFCPGALVVQKLNFAISATAGAVVPALSHRASSNMRQREHNVGPGLCNGKRQHNSTAKLCDDMQLKRYQRYEAVDRQAQTN